MMLTTRDWGCDFTLDPLQIAKPPKYTLNCQTGADISGCAVSFFIHAKNSVGIPNFR